MQAGAGTALPHAAGAPYRGYCAAKKEKVFGWRLPLVCTPRGLPAAFTLLPSGWHDFTPVHERMVEVPDEASVSDDTAYNSAPDEAVMRATGGGVLVP